MCHLLEEVIKFDRNLVHLETVLNLLLQRKKILNLTEAIASKQRYVVHLFTFKVLIRMDSFKSMLTKVQYYKIKAKHFKSV